MTPGKPDQPPRWLQRGKTPGVFEATLCSRASVGVALSTFYDEIGDLPVLGCETHGDKACTVTFECKPDEAWSLLQILQHSLSRTDVYLQPRDSVKMRLLVCDMDMTIVAAETLDEVADRLGMGERIAKITERAMLGEIDFDEALRERVAMLKGQPEKAFIDLADSLELNPGADELLEAARDADVYSVLVSGGFKQVAEPVARRLGFDAVYCNHLDVKDGLLTGTVRSPIVNADRKLNILQRTARKRGHGLSSCCAIGDGANDLPMLRAAGLGIAYRAKPILRTANACRIDATDLSSAIHFMRLGRV